MNEKKMSVPEEFQVVKKCRVREHGKSSASGKKPGDKVTVSGYDKAALVAMGYVKPVSEVVIKK